MKDYGKQNLVVGRQVVFRGTLSFWVALTQKKKEGYTTGKFLSGTENMKFWILVFFSFFFFLFFLRGLSCGFWWVSL